MNAIKTILKWVGILIGCIVIAILFAVWHGPDNRVDRYQKAVADKMVIPGMDADQVEKAWGKPDRVSSGFWGGVEVTQWFYQNRYVGFREGKVVAANANETK